jgi:PKD repeat protein
MTLPSFVGAVNADGGATAGNTYTNDFTALSLQDNDYLVWVAMIESNNITLTTPPAGFTLRYNAGVVGSRAVLVYDKVWHTGDAKSLSYVKSGGFADGNQLSAWRGVDPSGTRIYGTGKTRAGSPADTSLQTTALSITTTVADTRAILIAVEATSAAESGGFLTGPTPPSGWTQDAYKAQGTTIQTIAAMHKDMPTAGATGNATLTYQNTQASNAWAVQIGLPGVVASNVAPSASFTHSESGLQVTVNGTGSNDADGSIAAYEWDWGDGSAHSFGATPTAHVYSAPGTYSVKLTVTDNLGATGTQTQSVTVTYPTATVTKIVAGVRKTFLVWKGTGGGKAALGHVWTVGRGVQTVSALLAKPGFVVGHLGARWDEVEGSMAGITRALMWGADALMVYVARSSDGVFFLLNDTKYLDRMVLDNDTGTTLDSSTMTWAQINAYDQGSYWTKRNTETPRRPFVKLVDVLAAYPTAGPILLDPKTIPSTYWPALLDIMDANGGPSRFIGKYYATGTAWADAVHARNAAYKTWGYFYAAEIANGTTDLDALSPKWDLLGLDYGGASAQWTQVLAKGKPVIGHIAKTRANYDTAIAKGASGVMCEGVAEVRLFA